MTECQCVHDANGRCQSAAAALESAADAWSDEGRDVMFNKLGDDLTPQQRVGKWLRTRAEAIKNRPML